MGNKQTRPFYDKLEEAFDFEDTLTSCLSLTSISEPELVSFFFNYINKKIKIPNVQIFHKSFNYASAPEESNEEFESRKKQHQELQLKTLLVSGHEGCPEVKAYFLNSKLNAAPAQKLQSASSISKAKTAELAMILLMMQRADNKNEASSFYERIGKYLSEGNDDEAGESSGISAALYFAVLLIDPKKLLFDSQISTSVFNMFMTMTPLSFYGWTKQNLIIDRSIEHIKRSLLEQIEVHIGKDLEISKENFENGIKTLCYIGLTRGSVEDFLIVIKLLTEFKITMDFTDILKKILDLPEIEGKTFAMGRTNLEYQFPFGATYIGKTVAPSILSATTTSATDGEYVYYYNNVHGLLLLGVGQGRLKGKLYESKGFIDSKCDVKLLVLKEKLYCWSEDRLFRLDMKTMKLKESKKVPQAENALVTGSGDLLLMYKKTGNEESEEGDNPKIHAEIKIYNVTTKKEPIKMSIVHGVSNISNIVLYKNVLLLVSSKQYEAIDLDRNTTIQADKDDILSQTTICCHPDSNKLNIIYLSSESEGYHFGQLSLAAFNKPAVPLLSQRIAEMKRLLIMEEKTTDSDNLISKHDLSLLLGIFTDKEEVKETHSSIAVNDIKCLLTLLAHRSIQTENFMCNASIENPEDVMKIYKSPIAIHLTVCCFQIQFQLIRQFFQEFLDKKEEALEKLCYMLIILNEHFVALGKCNVSLEDCVGPDGVKTYLDICKDILRPLAKDTHEVSNKELMPLVRQYCTSCIKKSYALGESELSVTFKLLHDLLKECVKTKAMSEELVGLVDWLNAPDNVEFLADRVLSRDKDSVALLDLYYSIEVEHFSEISQELITRESSIQMIYKMISPVFAQVIEKMFVLIWRKLDKKDELIQDVIVDFLPSIFYEHMQRVCREIKDSYSKYKKSIIKDFNPQEKSKTLGFKYENYCKTINNLLNEKMLLFHSYLMITSVVVELNIVPEQFIDLAKILIKSANELKCVFENLSAETKDFDILKKLEERFENSERPIKNPITVEKEYEFPEVKQLLVETTESIDIPPPTKNEIIISEMPKNKSVLIIAKDKPTCHAIVNCNHIKISAKIEYLPPNDKFIYNGFSIIIRPIVRFY